MLVAVALLAPAAAGAEIRLRDDLGREVRLAKAAERIVTLAPFLTEIAFAAGAGGKVVGVSAFSDHPPAARALPQVSNAVQVSVEPLVALKPDFVLAWQDAIRREDVERIAAFGIPVFVAQARKLEDVPRLLGVVGRATGHDTGATARDFERRLERVRAENAGKPRFAAFLEVWHRPLTTIAGGHFMSQALDICGADNVFGDARSVAPQVSWEALYARDPKVIVGAGSASDEAQFRANWAERAPALGAVKAGRLVFVDPDPLQRPTPRTPEGIADLCRRLDRFREP